MTEPSSRPSPDRTAETDGHEQSAQCSELHWRYDLTYGSIDRDIQEHLAERGGDRTQQYVAGVNLQRRRNAGEPILGWLQDHRVGLVKDLLTPDGQPRSGDNTLTGLGEALAGLDSELQMVVSAALYERATERLWMAQHAEQVSQHLPPEEFRDHALAAAEQAARLWREVSHVRRTTPSGECQRCGYSLDDPNHTTYCRRVYDEADSAMSTQPTSQSVE